ncbi:SDR family oxidoreductase [Martelella sp. AD-3]|uniref:SDR family NAD(P)-dependent oxidoreductase n=1 Tax=Martelella sp. AD-3 TaxID=686597 RepID=UPI00046578C8|nr:SDR family oxidoreductase [Martelella sp. AD-3]AMM85922.1 oxidoreductase [Martelella sp. AD-3]MAM09426.1 oxidoreductase [Rhizobiaceae bacterium]
MIKADLKGKRALVTGGASGIGLATVTMLAEMGAKVAINHLEGDPAGPEKVAELQAQGLDVVAAPGNISIPGNAEAMVETAIETMGGLDYLVNNAGTSGTRDKIPPSDLDRMTEDFWQLLLGTNLIGPFRCAHAAAPALKQSRGAIVNMASIAGIGQQGSSIAYAASKSGLVSLTRSLARGLAPEVRVNAVAPGQTRTPWTDDWPEERKQWARDLAVLKRRSEPEDIAEAVLYLCAGASMVTGHVLVVDGGMTL